MQLHLPSLKTFVFTCANTTQRQPKIERNLKKLKFTNWEFVYGEIGPERYWKYIKKDFYRILDTVPCPFMILEDDIEFLSKNYVETIEYPDNTDVLYLGGGPKGYGHYHHTALLEYNRNDIKTWGTATIADIQHPDWVRVISMIYTHALIFLSDDCKEDFKYAINWQYSLDINQSKIQYKWNCLLRRKPFWWQDDKHHTHYHTKFDLTTLPSSV